MASKTALLLLALLGAVACLHFVAADEVVHNAAGGMDSFETSLDVERNSGFDKTEGDDDVEFSEDVEAEAEENDNSPGSRRPLSLNIHIGRSSRRCWSTLPCKKHFEVPGCCKRRCVNLASDNRNCGACGTRCGYGKRCCDGHCKNVFGNDKNHCGACGKKCDSKCEFGMCGYGH